MKVALIKPLRAFGASSSERVAMSQFELVGDFKPQSGAAVDASGAAVVYNVTAATVIKASPGRMVRVDVIVAGSSAGSVNDCTTTAAAAVGNQLAVIPNAVGPLLFDWPCKVGVVVVPGTGQTIAVAFC